MLAGKEFIWLGNLLLMRRWVWNAYSIIILADNCGCGVICHCGMSRGHCCILGTTLSRVFWQLTTPLNWSYIEHDVEQLITSNPCYTWRAYSWALCEQFNIMSQINHMKNNKRDTFGHRPMAAAGGSVTSTEEKPWEIVILSRTPWMFMTPQEKKEVQRICDEMAELTSDKSSVRLWTTGQILYREWADDRVQGNFVLKLINLLYNNGF